MDRQDIRAGANWDHAVDEALDTCACMLIVLSPQAIASREVQGELRTALDADKSIVLVHYQGVPNLAGRSAAIGEASA